jgi:predicted AAA+ superfamily ATPase
MPFVSLDLPSEAEEAERNPSDFLARHGSPLVVDEVQYAPRLFRHLKLEVDKRRTQKGQYVLTGSQKFSLMKGISESLAGRIDILELEPLSLREIRKAYTDLHIHQILIRGGYPELYEDLTLKPFPFYRSYVATYLERDLRSILNVASLRDFERFLRACALRTGQLVNKADLARDVGISASTANEWLSALTATNIVVLLEPWFVNASKSIAKSPKLFFADTGLLLYLLNVRSADELLHSPLLGSIWETFVFSEMRKIQEGKTGSWSINFWRDRGKEIDFLVYRGGLYDLYEVKWTEHPGSGDARAFRDLEKVLRGGRVASKTIVCRTSNAYPIAEDVRAVPVEDLVREVT